MSVASHTNPLVPTNMHGAAVPHRLAMGLPPPQSTSLGGLVAAPSRSLRHAGGSSAVSLASIRSRRPTESRFEHSSRHEPAMVGGNTLRVSASDAAILSLASLSKQQPPLQRSPTQRPRTRDPIIGAVPEPAPRRVMTTESTPGVFRYGNREFPFPERGSIAQMPTGSPHSDSRSRKKLEYDLWLEAQKRTSLEKCLKQVVIHGRSRPPWIGEYGGESAFRFAGR